MDSVAEQAETPSVNTVQTFEEWLEPQLWQKHAWSFLAQEVMLWKDTDLCDTELAYENLCNHWATWMAEKKHVKKACKKPVLLGMFAGVKNLSVKVNKEVVAKESLSQ